MLDNGTAIAVETLTDNSPVPTSDLDPRWYLNTIEREARVNGYECGFSVVKYAEFGCAQVFSVPEEFHTIDDNPNLPREQMKQHSALEVERKLGETYGGKDYRGNLVATKPNKGIQFGFVGEKDAAKMSVISATVLPTLPRIRQIAEEFGFTSPIDAVCAGQDDLDFGERQSCPTCWFKWIDSELCKAYIADIAANGREVYHPATPDQKWIVRPSVIEFEQARALAETSLQTGLQYLNNEWRIISGELEKGTRNDLDEGGYQHSIRKDIHQTKPQDRQLKLVQEVARANAGNGGGDNSEILAMLAKSSMETNALLRQIAGGTPVPQPAATPAPVAAPVSDEPDTIIENIAAVFEPDSNGYALADPVLVDGEPGTITEVKTGGWYAVQTATGIKTVRKGNLTKEN